MKSDVTYDLLIIGGGISACVFASKYLKNNITKKVGLIEIGRGLGGRSSTRISKKYKGWKLNHGSPNFNISNSKNNLLLKKYIDELLENKLIKIDDSEIFFLNEDPYLETIKNSEFFEVLVPYEYFNFGLTDSIKVENGYAHLPSKSGLGIDLDWDFIDNTTFKKI